MESSGFLVQLRCSKPEKPAAEKRNMDVWMAEMFWRNFQHMQA